MVNNSEYQSDDEENEAGKSSTKKVQRTSHSIQQIKRNNDLSRIKLLYSTVNCVLPKNE